MNSLRCTNFLLMVIALCLINLCLRIDSTPSDAANKPTVQAVKVVNVPTVNVTGDTPVRLIGSADVNISGVYGYKWKGDVAEWRKGCIPVCVENPAITTMPHAAISQLVTVQNVAPIDVNITNDPLPVEVDDTQDIPVEVKNVFPIPVHDPLR